MPSVARIYDYFLGGKDNFAVDREAADQITAMMPFLPGIARSNRAFIRRVVRALVRDHGIRQFIDVGAGLPAQQSVHAIAQEIAPDTRVVYIDNDPVVCSHGRALLQGRASAMVEGDLLAPDAIIDHPMTRSLINFSEPFALLLTAVLHFVPDEANPGATIARFRDAMAPGSFLVISHGTLEGGDGLDERVELSAQVYKQAQATLSLRRLDAVRALFDGFELIDPGLVWIQDWPAPTESPINHEETLRGGVGRLPG
jgi:S-adenosyl methyltransferase